ncbi:hypothetical protein ACLMJK_007535 [Lecanora helva]
MSFEASQKKFEGKNGTIRDLDTTEAYDRWSEVYDTDGNFLQALDSIEMSSLLPQLLEENAPLFPLKIVDLGCGTGRSTQRLLSIPEATIIGLDASPRMLEIAKTKLSKTDLTGIKSLDFSLYNMLVDSNPPSCALNADAVISTLVLEHIPLPRFFQVVHQILKPGGIALITNMHSDMGRTSQAGFVDPSSGVKIRPQSYVHRLPNVLEEAAIQGFDFVGDAIQRCVDEEMISELGARAKKWIGVTVWFGFLIRKIPQDESVWRDIVERKQSE